MKKLSKTLSVIFAVAALLGLMACSTDDSSYGEKSHVHTFASEWLKDENFHWHAATCEHTTEISGRAAHAWNHIEYNLNTSTGVYERSCTVCGFIEAKNISFEYDSKGNIVKKTFLDLKGNVMWYVTFAYNTEGKLNKYASYNPDDTLYFNYEAASDNYISVCTDSRLVSFVEECNSNGNKVKGTYYSNDGAVDYSKDYDSNGKVVKYTKYNSDGTAGVEYDVAPDNIISIYTNLDGSVNYIKEFDSNGNDVKYTRYNTNGTVDFEYAATSGNCNHISMIINTDGTVDYIKELDSNGNEVKYTKYNSDGSVDYSKDYDSNGRTVKCTEYNSDGSVKLVYAADPGNYVIEGAPGNILIFFEYVRFAFSEYDSNDKLLKSTMYKSDGSLYYIYEYNYIFKYNEMLPVKYTEYNSDGSVRLEYTTAPGNYISTFLQMDRLVFGIRENNGDERGVKETFYNIDGSVKYYLIYEYDSNGKNVKYANYNSDGKVNFYSTHEYDSNGLYVKYTRYNSDDSVYFDYTAAPGNYISFSYSSGFDGGGGILNVQNSYLLYISEYDRNGEFLKCTYYNPDGSIKKVINY